jgi:hypothetical protein
VRWLWAAMALAGCAFDSKGGNMPATIDAAAVTSDGPLYGGADAHYDASPMIDARPADAAPDANCPATCNPGDDPCCPFECASGQSCSCPSNHTCYFRCTGTDCNVTCSGNASCSVDCGAATGTCTAMCSGSSASCAVACVGASNCSLSCNPQSTTYCSSNAYVCGRTCP